MRVLAGCIIGREQHAIAQIIPILQPDHFYRADHHLVFQALLERYNEGHACDLVILRDRLKSKEELTEIGGADYLVQIPPEDKEMDKALGNGGLDHIYRMGLDRLGLWITSGQVNRTVRRFAAEVSNLQVEQLGDYDAVLSAPIEQLEPNRQLPSLKQLQADLCRSDRLWAGNLLHRGLFVN